METTREQFLIGRVIGREDRVEDWVALRELAAADQRVWQRLAAGLEDDATLRQAAGAEVERVAGAASPDPLAPTEPDGADPHAGLRRARGAASVSGYRRPRVRLRRGAVAWLACSGWLLAAALFGLWASGLRFALPTRAGGAEAGAARVRIAAESSERGDPHRSRVVSSRAADTASSPAPSSPAPSSPAPSGGARTAAAGDPSATQFVGELPRVLLSTTPTADGRFRLLYMRRLVERVEVQELYEIRRDELDQPWPAVAQPSAYARPQTF